MRVGLLIVAALALIGFIAVAVVLPEMAGAKSREAAAALIAGAEPGKQQVDRNVERSGKLLGAGNGVKIPPQQNQHGNLKWIVEDDGTIRGWNEQNALEIAVMPTLEGGKVNWRCKGYPVNSMPPTCGGR
ncbi:MAG TPA: hypothetical protein VFV74_11065 [Burkholderiales bacterium]|nr:hypothetical protein [Burkholderiales bacterium]